MSSNLDFISEIIKGRQPLDQNHLTALVMAMRGHVDLVLSYDKNLGYLTFARFTYEGEKVEIPIRTIRGTQRCFKDLHRCFVWGKQQHLRTANIKIELSEYNEA